MQMSAFIFIPVGSSWSHLFNLLTNRISLIFCKGIRDFFKCFSSSEVKSVQMESYNSIALKKKKVTLRSFLKKTFFPLESNQYGESTLLYYLQGHRVWFQCGFKRSQSNPRARRFSENEAPETVICLRIKDIPLLRFLLLNEKNIFTEPIF